MANYISPRAQIADSAYLGNGVNVYGPSIIGENCIIEDNVIIGKPDRNNLESLRGITNTELQDYDAAATRETVIGPDTVLRTGTQVYEGCELAKGVGTENYVRIGWDSSIGPYSRIMYRALIYVNVTVGSDTWVGGFVSNNTRIKDNCSFFGSSIHHYPPAIEDPDEDDPEQLPAPTVCSQAIVGFGAQLIGGIQIGEDSYVGANAVVTKDVPDNHIVVNHDECFSRDEWERV